MPAVAPDAGGRGRARSNASDHPCPQSSVVQRYRRWLLDQTIYFSLEGFKDVPQGWIESFSFVILAFKRFFREMHYGKSR